MHDRQIGHGVSPHTCPEITEPAHGLRPSRGTNTVAGFTAVVCAAPYIGGTAPTKYLPRPSTLRAATRMLAKGGEAERLFTSLCPRLGHVRWSDPPPRRPTTRATPPSPPSPPSGRRLRKTRVRRPCSADSSRVGGPKAGKGREGGGLLRNRHPTATAEARGSLLAGMGLVSLIMWVAIAAIARVVIKEVFGKKK